MSVKEVEKANATRVSEYAIYKYTLTNTSNTIQINTNKPTITRMREIVSKLQLL